MLRFDGIQHGLELLGDVGDDVIVGDAVVYAVHVVESLDGLIDGAFRCVWADVGNGLCQCHLGAIRIDKADVYKGLAHMAPGLAVALANGLAALAQQLHELLGSGFGVTKLAVEECGQDVGRGFCAGFECFQIIIAKSMIPMLIVI